MKFILALLFLFPLTGSCASSASDIKRCEAITIAQAGLTDAAMIKDQKSSCQSDPLYEICMYEGVKQYHDSGTLPPNDHLEAMDKNCSLESHRSGGKP